jgi:hypothetical protein
MLATMPTATRSRRRLRYRLLRSAATVGARSGSGSSVCAQGKGGDSIASAGQNDQHRTGQDDQRRQRLA